MLKGLHPAPQDAARELLGRFSPVITLKQKPKAGSEPRPLAPERWTLGLILARWLLRLGWGSDVARPTSKPQEDNLRERMYDSISQMETERMVAIFCDARGRILSQELVAEGDTGQLRLSLRQLFTKALRRNARRMILAHNHPSGCPQPSEGDIVSTRRLSDYARSLGIVLEDHLIIGHDSITSMRKAKLL